MATKEIIIILFNFFKSRTHIVHSIQMRQQTNVGFMAAATPKIGKYFEFFFR